MGAAHKIKKGIIAGLMIGAAAAYAIDAAKKSPSAKAATKAAKEVAKRAMAHAKKVGAITKSSYDAIVEKTVAEARGASAMTKAEVDEMRDELRSSWKDLAKMMAKNAGKKK